VALKIEGSSPFAHPIICMIFCASSSTDRASVFGTEGWGFESLLARIYLFIYAFSQNSCFQILTCITENNKFRNIIKTCKEFIMANYSCSDCGMEVGDVTCGKCGTSLEHKEITKDDGSIVAVAECPNGDGKIKSPMCCGQDMVAAN
jgi:DNA-directed RNA polymerase subunit RPC12/RpoP